MVVWLEGGLDPNKICDQIMIGDKEFGARLLALLDDSIANSIPELPPIHSSNSDMSSRHSHPCSTRGVDPDLPEDVCQLAEREDLHHLVKVC